MEELENRVETLETVINILMRELGIWAKIKDGKYMMRKPYAKEYEVCELESFIEKIKERNH